VRDCSGNPFVALEKAKQKIEAQSPTRAWEKKGQGSRPKNE